MYGCPFRYTHVHMYMCKYIYMSGFKYPYYDVVCKEYDDDDHDEDDYYKCSLYLLMRK